MIPYSKPNVNPETGISYGYLSDSRMDYELAAQLIYGSQAVDHSYKAARAEAEAVAKVAWENLCEEVSVQRQEDGLPAIVHDDFEFDEDAFDADYQCEEPSVSGICEGVHYHSSYLGGALHFFISFSPVITHTAGKASPCVPNCGILGSEGDVTCYDVPADWYFDHG